MKRMGAVTAVTVGVLAIMPASQAAPASPTPTVTITTSVGTQALPVSPMTGAWQVVKPGRQATLEASGLAATGTVTTLRSTWVSAMHRGVGLKFSCEGDFATVVPGSANGVTIRIRFRTRHGHWQPFGGVGYNGNPQPLSSGGQGVGAFVEFLHPVQAQWQLTVTATYDDTSRQTFREQVRAV
jgi:hypothetical protein